MRMIVFNIAAKVVEAEFDSLGCLSHLGMTESPEWLTKEVYRAISVIWDEQLGFYESASTWNLPLTDIVLIRVQ